MADGIDTSISDMWWLKPQGWAANEPNTFLEGQRVRQEGLRIAQQESQFRRSQVMDMLQFNLREKEANVRMTTEIQQQKEYHDYLDDLPKLNAYMAHPDSDPPTDLKTAKALSQAELIQRNSARQKATEEGVKRLSDAESDILKYGDEQAISDVLSVRSDPKLWGQVIAHYAPKARETKLKEQKELYTARGTGVPIASKYLNLADSEDALATDFESQGDADSAKMHRDRAKNYRDLASARGPAKPIAQKYNELADEEDKEAESLRVKGDVAGYQEHQQRAKNYRELAAPKTSSTEITMGPEGPKVVQTYGPKPTSAMTTEAQKKIVRYEDALTLINQLQKSLSAEDVGAAGVVGEFVLDRALPQIPGMSQYFSGARVQKRTALGALRESLLRQISDDPRFSNVDRETISNLLPSTGILESLPDAMARMDQVKKILVDRISAYSGASGAATPASAKPRDQIISEYNTAVQKLSDAVKENRLTPQQAYEQAQQLHKQMTDNLQRYH